MTSATPGLRMGTTPARWVLLATILGSGLVMLDATVVNVALPRIGTDLDADFGGLQWVVNGYTLTLAAFVLLGGSLGDRYGRRRIFIVGTVWFAVASLLCGLAPNIETLAAARALQGIGGALLTPGSLAIIAATFDASDRSRAVGAWSGLGGIAGAVGPFAGGWLVEWNWRAVFLVNLPVAAVVVVVAAKHVPETLDPDASPRLDIAGSVLGALGLGLLTYGLIAAGDRGADPLVLATCAAGVAVLGAFLVEQRRSSHPLVPLDLFSNRQFTVINVVTFIVYGAIGVFFFLVVLDLQVVAGFSPLLAGAALLPATGLMLLLSSRMGALADRVGARLLISVGLLLAAGGVLLTRRIGPGASYWADVLPCVALFGLGLSVLVAPLTATVLGSVSRGHAGIASGVNNAVARAAGLLAVAVIPVAAGIGGSDYRNPAALEAGFRMAMLICTVLLLLGAVLSWVLLREPAKAPAAPEPQVIDLAKCAHCGVTGPQLHPETSRAA